jgi:hypothetical protein
MHMTIGQKAVAVTVAKVAEGIQVTFPDGSACVVQEEQSAEDAAREYLHNNNADGLGMIHWMLPARITS